MLDEMERALHDSLSVVKRTLESGKVVPGGGAVETALSIYLENFATTLVSFRRKIRRIIFLQLTKSLYGVGISRTIGNSRIRKCASRYSKNFGS